MQQLYHNLISATCWRRDSHYWLFIRVLSVSGWLDFSVYWTFTCNFSYRILEKHRWPCTQHAPHQLRDWALLGILLFSIHPVSPARPGAPHICCPQAPALKELPILNKSELAATYLWNPQLRVFSIHIFLYGHTIFFIWAHNLLSSLFWGSLSFVSFQT